MNIFRLLFGDAPIGAEANNKTKTIKQRLINIWHSDEMVVLKLVIIAIPVCIGISKCSRYFSVPQKKITYKIEVFYTNGKPEIIKMKKNHDGKPPYYFYNGCIYRSKSTPTMFEGYSYSNPIRCGVKYCKKINTKFN